MDMVRSMAPLFRQVQDPDGRVCQFQEVTMNQLHMTETTTVMTMAVMEKANVVPVSTGLPSAIEGVDSVVLACGGVPLGGLATELVIPYMSDPRLTASRTAGGEGLLLCWRFTPTVAPFPGVVPV